MSQNRTVSWRRSRGRLLVIRFVTAGGGFGRVTPCYLCAPGKWRSRRRLESYKGAPDGRRRTRDREGPGRAVRAAGNGVLAG
jgi:hypothetical protein